MGSAVTVDLVAERESAALRQMRDRLTGDDERNAAVIDAAIARAVNRFSGARIRDFVPLLVERLVRDELKPVLTTKPDPR
jgi:hypothetical protein